MRAAKQVRHRVRVRAQRNERVADDGPAVPREPQVALHARVHDRLGLLAFPCDSHLGSTFQLARKPAPAL